MSPRHGAGAQLRQVAHAHPRPHAWHPEASAGHVGGAMGRESPPGGALGTEGEGSWGGHGSGGCRRRCVEVVPSGWQEPGRLQRLWQEAPLMAGWEPGAFLKTAFPVKSLLFLICGCQSQSCQGWRLGGGAGRLPRAGRAPPSCHRPRLSRQGLPPAQDVRGAGGLPCVHHGGGEVPVLRQREHPWLHPVCTPRDPSWDCGAGRA